LVGGGELYLEAEGVDLVCDAIDTTRELHRIRQDFSGYVVAAGFYFPAVINYVPLASISFHSLFKILQSTLSPSPSSFSLNLFVIPCVLNPEIGTCELGKETGDGRKKEIHTINIFIPRVLQAQTHDLVCCRQDLGLIDVAGECVPGVPA